MTKGLKGQSLGHQLGSELQPGTVKSAGIHTSAIEHSSGSHGGGISENVSELGHILSCSPVRKHHKPGQPPSHRPACLQAHAVQQLHECVAELESALEKQQRRADLLQQELSHLRASGGSHREQGRGLPISWQQDQHHDVKEHAVNGRTTTR